MSASYDVSKIRPILDNLTIEIKTKKKLCSFSWLGCILPLCVSIVISIFIILAYTGLEFMELIDFEYFRPIEFGTALENLTVITISTSKIFTYEQKPFFKKHPIAKDLQCDIFFGNITVEEVQNIVLPRSNVTYVRKRIAYKDEPEEALKSDCESIKKRHYFPTKPRTDFEANFPMAIARIVYTDYLFLEMELAASYAPQNAYCYMIDKKATPLFHERMLNLTKCFTNIVSTPKEYKVDSAGHNMWPAFVECMYALQKFEWKYVMLLQNHDIIAKTNFEIANIFTWFNGANDVQVGRPMNGRVNMKLNWTFEGLNLFRNESRNLVGAYGYPPQLNWAKGYVEASLSRPMVDFMLNDLNLTKLLQQLETGSYGLDEILLPTLQATDALGAPGGFTHACLDKGIAIAHITRFSVWYYKTQCPTKHLRHSICIFGVEDLERLTKIPRLFINKFLPSFDFGALTCWYEHLFNRTYLKEPTVERLDKKVYWNMPNVRFQREKLNSNRTFDPMKFNCT